jgi:carbonic anhydrase
LQQQPSRRGTRPRERKIRLPGWLGGSGPRLIRAAQPTKRVVKWAIDELTANAIAREADFEGLRAVIPAKHVAIVTCMDSRIDLFRIFGLDSGEAHILRNAGGLVTEDMLRSLVLSQRLLQTREIILMHHTNCGLHGADEPALRAAINADTGATPAYEFGAFSDIDEAVAGAILRVRAHPFLPHRDRVRGYVYEVESGHLREVVA